MQSICLWTDVNAFLMAEKYQYNNKLRLGFISLAVMAFYCISNVNVWLVKYFVVSTGSLYLLNVYQYIESFVLVLFFFSNNADKIA